MPAQRKDRRPADTVPDQVQTQLRLIKASVTGVTGSLAATSDGLVVAHDIVDAEPSRVAALAAATLALASRATLATGCGTFRETVARGTDGYLAVYAAGPSVIVAVIGTSSLNVGMLQYRARKIIERIAEHTKTWAAAAPAPTAEPAAPVAPAAPAAPATPVESGRVLPAGARPGTAQLPKRRPAAPA